MYVRFFLHVLPASDCVCAPAPSPVPHGAAGADVAETHRVPVAVETGSGKRQRDAACVRRALGLRKQGATVPAAPLHLQRERERERERNEKRMNKGFSFASRQVSLIALKAYWFTAIRFHFFSVLLFFHSLFSFQKSSFVPRATPPPPPPRPHFYISFLIM